MLQARDSQIANIFKQRVLAVTPARRMVVFGSRARGDATRDLDLDIFVEVSRLDDPLRRKIGEIARETSDEYEVVIAPFVTSTQ